MGSIEDDLRSWGYYRTAIWSLRVAAAAFALILMAGALMFLGVGVQVVGVIAAVLFGICVLAFANALPLFARMSRIHADMGRERGGHTIDDGLPLVRTFLSDLLRGFR